MPWVGLGPRHDIVASSLTNYGCQVTATGASAIRVPAVQPSAAGSRLPRPMAEMPTPELPTPVAVTRHLEVRVLVE